MNKHVMWTTTLVQLSTLCEPWGTILEQKRHAMASENYQFLSEQLLAYANQTSPKIADPAIKTIPIIECGEELVSVADMLHERIAMLPQPKNPFASPACNSGLPAAPLLRKSVYNNLVRMISALDEYAEAFGYQPGYMCIRVFEGLRNLETQKLLFDNKLQEIRAMHQHFSEDELIAETSKWVSPVTNNIPVHSTGGAVDIRIWNAHDNTFLDVGDFGVIWGPNPTAPTFSEEITDQQKHNRLYVLLAALCSGLTNYSYEHWHFSSGDRYACFWLVAAQPSDATVEPRSLSRAIYGAIE
jgi:D-alanyl-D-alanine dipeptidase